MSAIGPGDFVEALESCEALQGCIAVTAGNLYVVERVGDPALCWDCGDTSPWVALAGDDPDADGCWCTCCEVRFVYRPRADLIETLLQPVDGVSPELEPA